MLINYSIITASFNSHKTIERTIKSLLSQKYQQFEYIIIDGGSTDGTIEIINKYAHDFSGRLNCISEADTGIYNAMNKGLKMAKGDVIGIVNSDDWLEENALQSLSDYILSNKINIDSAFILTGFMNFHYKNNEVQIMRTSENRFIHYAKKYRMGLNHPATFVSTKTYKKIGLFDENLKLYADADFVIRCYKADVKIYFLETILSNMADEGASNKISRQSLLDRIYILNKYSKNKREYLFLYTKSVLLYYIKAILPISILKMIRYAKY